MKTKYVVDSSAWIEYLGGTSKGLKFKEIIEQEDIASSIITIAEVADKFERENKKTSEPINFIICHAKIFPLDVDICLSAAKIKKEARKVHKKFSLADGIHLSTSRKENSVLVTSDEDFEGFDNVILV